MKYWTRYLATYPDVLLYMLQDTEYSLDRYFAWYGRTADFRKVMKRRKLDVTSKIKLLRIVLWSSWFIVLVAASTSLYLSISTRLYIWSIITFLIILALPLVLAFSIAIPLFIGKILIQNPREKILIDKARQILTNHKGLHIAVVGSFGKTTAKEILATILGEGKKVVATPGNMNTAIGISRFAAKLTGDEEIVIFELGEEKVGDIAYLSELTRPTIGVITGVNEAHLESFGTLDNTVATIFGLVDYMSKSAIVYKNTENNIIEGRIKKTDKYGYSRSGVDGWRISKIDTSLKGTNFIAKKGTKTIAAHTSLIGEHTIGVTAMAIDLADQLGLSVQQIEAGLSKIKPFEHRMEPRRLHGAWVIDDTYNGNSDGVEAGLALLKNADAKRRIYVTPGLVEQGQKVQEVHEQIGKLVAKSADIVVLMKNSVTDYIITGLNDAKFKGELRIVDDPLDFYTNLEHFVAAGDVVLMQNDWTDNYQ
jgi:UDP-N-acetylmuramoyl-tripeptide--D-alanyl-D-alanine ligase